MPRLDRFLEILRDQRGEAVRLAAGQPAALLTSGGARALTKEPLTDAQVLALVKELAPADVAATLGANGPARFAYASPIGAVQVELVPGAQGLVAQLRPAGGAAAATPAPAAAPDPAVRAAMETLLRRLAESGASDLHLRSESPPVLRLQGELRRDGEAPLAPAELERMLEAIMGPREVAEYHESNDVDWAYEIAGVARFRCNAGRDRRGPIAVFRIIATKIPTAQELGLPPEIQALCQLTKGLVLVTGPTGSGKSTTLAAMIDLVNRTRHDHILTIEDPIEFVHQNQNCLVTQREVGRHTRTFKAALRAALREDPDVVLVGEMRDLETVSIALETAETGHLVFGTLHTTTAAGTVDRIIDQFPADRQSQVRVMLSESLRGVISQTLCRKVGGGRVAAREVLLSVPAISNLIREGKTFQIPSIMQTNRKVGMVTLNDALLELVDKGLVEPKEAWTRAVEKAGFAQALKARRHDTSFLADA